MVTKTLNSKAFVFDLDGTLIDTTPLVIKYWTDIAKEYNLDPSQVRNFFLKKGETRAVKN